MRFLRRTLGYFPVLAVKAVQVAARGCDGKGGRPREHMEYRFFLDGVDMHGAGVPVDQGKEFSVHVRADAAVASLALGLAACVHVAPSPMAAAIQPAASQRRFMFITTSLGNPAGAPGRDRYAMPVGPLQDGRHFHAHLHGKSPARHIVGPDGRPIRGLAQIRVMLRLEQLLHQRRKWLIHEDHPRAPVLAAIRRERLRGLVHFVLPVRIGEAAVASGLDERLALEAIRGALS